MKLNRRMLRKLILQEMKQHLNEASKAYFKKDLKAIDGPYSAEAAEVQDALPDYTGVITYENDALVFSPEPQGGLTDDQKEQIETATLHLFEDKTITSIELVRLA